MEGVIMPNITKAFRPVRKFYIYDKVADKLCFTFDEIDIDNQNEHFQYAQSLVQASPENYMILTDAYICLDNVDTFQFTW